MQRQPLSFKKTSGNPGARRPGSENDKKDNAEKTNNEKRDEQKQKASDLEENKEGWSVVQNQRSKGAKTNTKPSTVPSTKPKISSPCMVANSASADPLSEPQPAQPEKTKKKRPKKTKEERRIKREEARFHELYKPKDSRVRLINPDMFKLLKGESTAPKPSHINTLSFDPPTASLEASTSTGASGSNWKGFRFNVSNSPSDFPSLDDVKTRSTPGNSKPKPIVVNSSEITEIGEAETLSVSSESKPKPSWPAITDLFRPTFNESAAVKTATGAEIKPVKQKLSVTPLVVSLDVLLENSKTKSSNILGKQISRKRNDRSSAVKRENHKLTMGNRLDSSGPSVIHRGKIRQKPKKPSKLKKAILKSRQLRKGILPSELVVSTELDEDEAESESLVAGSLTNKTILEDNKCDNKPDEPPDSNVEECLSSSMKVLEIDPQIKVPKKVTTAFKNIDINSEDKYREKFKEIIDNVEEESKRSPLIPTEILDVVKLQMHCRKFRPYCDMFVSKELFGLVMPLMRELHRLQDRLYKTDPIKFKTKRRYVNGLKDVAGVLKLNKAQLIILAPDIEQNKEQGGLDDKVLEIVSLAQEKKVAYIFAGNRYILGKCIMQTKSPVSAIAVIDKQSVEEQFNRVLEEAEILRVKYQSEFNQRVVEAMANGG